MMDEARVVPNWHEPGELHGMEFHQIEREYHELEEFEPQSESERLDKAVMLNRFRDFVDQRDGIALRRRMTREPDW